MLFSVAGVVAFGYVNLVILPNYGPRLELHDQIVAGTAPAPYQYRILVPALAEASRRAFATVITDRRAFVLAYALYDLLAIFALLALLHVYLQNWFTRDQALIGALFVAGTLPIALRDHYFQPWSLLEAALFTAALHFAYRGRFWPAAAVVFLASLNRETAIFIPLAIAFVYAPDWRSLRRWLGGGSGKSGPGDPQALSPVRNDPAGKGWKTIALFGICAVVCFGLRYARGPAEDLAVLPRVFARNVAPENLVRGAVNVGLFLGVFWVLAVLGYRLAPRFIQRAAAITPFYLMAFAIWGTWVEARLLMPLYPLLVPLAMSFLYRSKMPDSVA
jgi:hypothetical protein